MWPSVLLTLTHLHVFGLCLSTVLQPSPDRNRNIPAAFSTDIRSRYLILAAPSQSRSSQKGSGKAPCQSGSRQTGRQGSITAAKTVAIINYYFILRQSAEMGNGINKVGHNTTSFSPSRHPFLEVMCNYVIRFCLIFILEISKVRSPAWWCE